MFQLRPPVQTYCSLMQGRKRPLPDDGDHSGLRRLLTVRVALIFLLPAAIVLAIILLSCTQ